MSFEILGEITDIETIARGNGIRQVKQLLKWYGKGHWRKLNDITDIRLETGRIRRAELRRYEAHGIGKKEIERKRYPD